MCFKVVCRYCGNFTWNGCGKHLKTLYASIDQGQRCMCQPWPGVVIPTEDTTQEQPSTDASTSEASTGDAKA